MSTSTTSAFVARWRVPLLLMAVNLVSMLRVGAFMVPGTKSYDLPLIHMAMPTDWGAGIAFAVPLMAILLAHEFGHYIAGKRHRVAISPPFFIPMPGFLLGTMGAVIRMPDRIRTRNALLDIGAAGPLAGLCVAIPVLIYGMATSPVEALPTTGDYLIEGRSILYLGLLWLLHGPIPPGQDIMLNPTAFAGWAGLLVTMINLLPVGQLDGGHVAYALLGKRQDTYSRWIRRGLPLLALGVSLAYAVPAFLSGARGDALINAAFAGAQWLVWAGLLWLMARYSGAEHPPTDDDVLSPTRRRVAVATLLLFVILFMPSWVRQGSVAGAM